MKNPLCEDLEDRGLRRILYFATDSAHATNLFIAFERSRGSTALGFRVRNQSSTGDDQGGLQLHHAMRRFCPTAEDKFENPA